MEEEYYIYDGNQIVADTDSSGNILRSYTYGPGIDNVLSMTVYGRDGSPPPSAAYYYLKDHQNTVIALTDSSGTVVESYNYDAYGHVTVFDSSGNALTSDLGLPTSGVGNRYTFQGREIDWDTGLYYFRARWYNPETGRWLSKDPIGIAGGLNLYEFCGNNPVNRIDPEGKIANLIFYLFVTVVIVVGVSVLVDLAENLTEDVDDAPTNSAETLEMLNNEQQAINEQVAEEAEDDCTRFRKKLNNVGRGLTKGINGDD